jgi:HPt (histidine-containing phosphotransfer) domain-containing protein
VRNYVGGLAAGIAARRASFLERTRENAKALAGQRAALADPAAAAAAFDRIASIAHSIAGGGAIFGFIAMSRQAAELEAAVNAHLENNKYTRADIEVAVGVLIAKIEQT